MAETAVRFRAFSIPRLDRDAPFGLSEPVGRAVRSAGEAVCGQVCRKQGLVEGGGVRA